VEVEELGPAPDERNRLGEGREVGGEERGE